MNGVKPKILQATLLISVLLLGFAIYKPGLTGGYLSDDFSNIQNNQDLQLSELTIGNLIKAANSGISSYLGRPLSMLTFALNIYFNGDDPYYMKLVNILIHLFNGILIFLFTKQLLRLIEGPVKNIENERNIIFVAIAVTAAWVFHPVNLISVVYTVQRMNLLSALFTLLGLNLYISGRLKSVSIAEACAYFIGILICSAAAVLSKENGFLIIFYFVLLEMLFFKFSADDRRVENLLRGIYIFAALTLMFCIIYLLLKPELILAGYQGRPFTLAERLLTESRILWFYVYLIVLPNIRMMALNHDEIAISHGFIDPPVTLPAICGIVLVVLVAAILRKRTPFLSFGVLFFFIGHSMESTVVPLELVFEYRNYLPSYGIIFIVFYILLNRKWSPNLGILKKSAALALIGLFAVSTHIRAEQWGNSLALRFYELERNPNSARTNYEVARFYASLLDEGIVADREKIFNEAQYYFKRTRELQPDNIEALIGLVILNSSNGVPVEPAWRASLIQDLEYSPLGYTQAGAFRALLNCQGSHECSLDGADIGTMIEAIMKNRHVNNQVAALLYYNISLYYLNYLDDPATARKYAEMEAANKE